MKKELPPYRVLLLPVKEINELVAPLCERLQELDIEIAYSSAKINAEQAVKIDFGSFAGNHSVILTELVEYVIQQLPFEFEELPLLIEGESKIIRQLNSKIVVEKFKPTVYSFAQNSYGEVPGTAELRVLFTAELFRSMNRYNKEQKQKLKNAFLGIANTSDGPLLIQEKVETCNLEVRVKRYHIGSPVHRYKFTEKHATVQLSEKPLTKGARFEVPLICFDWRLPLTDEEGNRLADEPLSDDYAGVWMNNIVEAKNLARETFSWMEGLFRDSGLILIDICFFIDKTGSMLYGEISPDCMRVKEERAMLKGNETTDKTPGKKTGKEIIITKQYHKLYHILFGSTTKNNNDGKWVDKKQPEENASDAYNNELRQGNENLTVKSISECF